ncbi:hypothetical protein I5M32_11765 [Pedobacter sp. SD-b]|uniref:Tetratricopeptide repeat-containing protein n=1 Tax=Pedobacter segetis TaxID=2793069 RepID=A0ABS1BL71_9SPHI|nr:hypothetical protein [Pedobacter segetis]MBK0383635.1 hypothetical protein [Pedobacter segetis]
MNDDVQKIKETPYQSEINKAWDEFHKDNIDVSQQICLKLISQYSDKSSCNYLLGHIHRIKKLFQQSADEFQAALEKDNGSNAGYIYYWLGEIYGESGWGDDECIYIYDRNKSDQFYEQAKACESYPADLLFKNGYKLKGKQRVDNYELGISKFPEMPDFYIKLSHHYEQLGLSDLQLATLERALENDWLSASIFYNLGLFYYKKGNFSVARDYF